MKKLLPILLFLPAAAFAADEAHTVTQKGRLFRPAEVSINRGESLTFTNNDDFIHQIYVQSPSFAFDTDQKNPGKNISEPFAGPGPFDPPPHIHPKMKLLVKVSVIFWPGFFSSVSKAKLGAW